MDRLHNYVPTVVFNHDVVLPDGNTVNIATFFGDDQLTVTRALGAAMVRASHATTQDQLRGLVLVLEDCHSRLTVMRVSCIVKLHA
jgi:hypothetical protein